MILNYPQTHQKLVLPLEKGTAIARQDRLQR